MKRLSFAILIGLLSVATTVGLNAQVRTANSQVGLVAEVTSIAPGQTIDVALYINPDKGWHIYWINPGDAGRSPRVNWELPDGFEVSEFQFPIPHYVPFMNLMSYGYDGPTFFIAQVTAPDTLDEEIVLSGRADWLTCDDELCVPERANIELKIPRGDGSEFSVWRTDFADTRAQHPIKVDWDASFATTEERTVVDIDLPDGMAPLENPQLFPGAEKLIDHAKAQDISLSDQSVRFEMVAGSKADQYDEIMAVITTETGGGRVQSFELMAQRVDNLPSKSFDQSASVMPGDSFSDSGGGGSATGSDGGTGASTGGTTTEASTSIVEFLKIVGLAFLGGLILNAMPCVLPILSLKALAVANLAGHEPKAARIAGLSYFAGVLVCFGVLAGAMLGLRAGGSLVGWAFHLQHPTTIILLALLMTAVGFNFSGLFEIRGTFGNLGGLSEKLNNMGGSEFFTGLLAVAIASPCTGPFMGIALGYAIVQPLVVSLSVFAGLAVGFAFPYLLVTFFPPVRKILPKPGAWMDSMRRLLAFPMYGTAIWLVWILGQQTSVNNVAVLLILMLLMAFALWAWNRGREFQKARWHVTAGVGAMLLVTILVWPTPDPSAQSLQVKEVDWSEAQLSRFHGQSKPMFVYFTADWCTICKANEALVLRSGKVQQFLADNNVEVLVGDWTSEDPEITAELVQHGRAAVPMYLYYKPDGDIDKPIVLPSVLTPDLIMRTIQDA